MATSKLTRQVWKSELVEVKIPALTGTSPSRYQLGDYQNLRNVFLQGIVAYTVEEILVSPLSHLPVIGFDLFKVCFLTLLDYNGVEFDKQGPLADLHTTEERAIGMVSDLHQQLPIEYTEQKVSWSKSFIDISNTALIPDVDSVILLRVFYRETMAKEKAGRVANFKKQS